MDQPVAFVLDAPALPDTEGGTVRARLQVAKTGDRFRDPRYGSFAIGRSDFDAWRASLSLHPTGRALIDFEHASEKGGSSEAAGWVLALDQLGKDGQTATPDQLWADVEWTPLGASAIREKRYQFISPAYGPYVDEQGKKHRNVFSSVTLTNKPFLREGMPAVTLSQAIPEGSAAAELDDPGLSDSRGRMLAIKDIAEALGLDENADGQVLLDAIEELNKRPGQDEQEPADAPKTLEQAEAKVREEGKVILTQAQFDSQVERIKKLEDAATDRDFDQMYGTAVREIRVDTTDDTKTLYRDLYSKDPENTTKLLGSLPKLARTAAAGDTGEVDDAEAPAGVDKDRFALNRKVETRMAENKGEDYVTALDAVQAGLVAL